MFVIKPIRDRELQKEICKNVGADFDPEALAYFAAELDRTMNTITEYIGICQFRLGDAPEVVSLIPDESKIDDEAMIILLKTVMRFMNDAGCDSMSMQENAGPEALLKKCGIPYSDGKYSIDLNEYFESPCRFNAKTDS